jgi:glycosyltransferase involved in cell wall biosynthesis
LLGKLRTAWNLLRAAGFRAFLNESIDRLSLLGRDHGESLHLLPRPHEVASTTPLVSVVVPVHNPGSDLPCLLESLSVQVGVSLEVILVDSGIRIGAEYSSDQYPWVSVVPISPDSFSHSSARNLGVELAKGDWVLLTVQDARFPNPRSLGDLVSLAGELQLAAVSLCEISRGDADGYAQMSLSDYRNFLGLTESMTVVHRKNPRDRTSRRRASALNNVACLYRREVLSALPFRGMFGEDVDWGLRALEKGFPIARTSEILVEHSHTRTAWYWLRRQFASRRFSDAHRLSDPVQDRSDDTACQVISDWWAVHDQMGRVVFDLGTVDPELAAFLARWNRVTGSSTGPWYLFFRTHLDRALTWDCGDPLVGEKALASALGWVLGGWPERPWNTDLLSNL